MMMIMINMITPLMLTILLTTTCLILSKKSIMEREKLTPFECGFSPKSSSRTPFSIQFFMIAMIFLIFDIEMIIIIPFIMIMQNQMMFYSTITILMFTIILTMGLYYEWKNEMLEWSK